MYLPSLDTFGFMLAIDGCRRGCRHCPAHGLDLVPSLAPIPELRQRLTYLRRGLPAINFADFRTIHAWRIGDLGDYRYTAAGVTYDVLSVAETWLSALGQPLYYVTNGSIGSPGRRATAAAVAAHPELFSQVKLTITPFDPKFDRTAYDRNMAYDIATLWPLSRYPSHRYESTAHQRRFRINVKATAEQAPLVRARLQTILALAGLPTPLIAELLSGQHPCLSIKPVYDLRATDEQPIPTGAISVGAVDTRLKEEAVRDRYQLGVRPDGSLFTVDMWAFRETDLTGPAGPLRFMDHYGPVQAPA